METNINASIGAAMNLMDARRQMKELKEHEKQLKANFAETILRDAIAQPSRILRIDKYWRITGLLPMEVEHMVVRLIQDTDNPDFNGLKTQNVAIRRRYAEFDENGSPTGQFIEKTETTAVIINLGAVKLAEGDTSKPVLGSDSLIKPSAICQGDCCYYKRHGSDTCPNSAHPEIMWKCTGNWNWIQDTVNKILDTAASKK